MSKVVVQVGFVATLVAAALACAPVSADLTNGGGSGGPGSNPDVDGDGIADAVDNCLGLANADQADVDADGIGDACDSLIDRDADGVADAVDNCADHVNVDQSDLDVDGVGDVCDNCPAAGNLDQADADGDGIGDACPCDACDAGQWCVTHPAEGTSCLDDCPTDRRADDGVCCPLGSRGYPDGTCKLPDLHVEESRVTSSLEIEVNDYTASDCEVLEGCVAATGLRTVLRFDTTTPNDGAGDLHIGDPAGYANFVWSSCHNHYHFESYASYEVRDSYGNVVAPGHKQAFCLMDFEGMMGQPWWEGVYDCDYQGISTGWADTYDSYLDCQFVDITGVPDGDYTLAIHVNYAGYIAEEDYTNNIAEVPFTLPL